MGKVESNNLSKVIRLPKDNKANSQTRSLAQNLVTIGSHIFLLFDLPPTGNPKDKKGVLPIPHRKEQAAPFNHLIDTLKPYTLLLLKLIHNPNIISNYLKIVLTI